MIRIVTDSSCDLPADILERHRIAVVPLTIRFGDEDFVDGEQLTVDDFWERMSTSEDLPETAAPAVGRFQETFRDLSAAGADGIVAVLISSAISATHQSATLAADQLTSGIPVRVVDSRLVSAAAGLSVLAAARAAEAGATIDSYHYRVCNRCDPMSEVPSTASSTPPLEFEVDLKSVDVEIKKKDPKNPGY